MSGDGYLPELENIREYLGDRYFTYFKDYNLNKFQKGIRLFHVELHWAIAENDVGVTPRVNSKLQQWDEEIDLIKASVHLMDKTAHFSALLVHHALKDSFKSLKNIVDIAVGLSFFEANQQIGLMRNDFSNHQLLRAFDVSVSLSRQLLGVAPNYLQSSRATLKVTEHFLNQVCDKKVVVFQEQNNIPRWMINRALLQDNLLNKLNFYLICLKYRFVPGPSDFGVIRFPKRLFFLYYLMKPFRTLIKPTDFYETKKKLVPQV